MKLAIVVPVKSPSRAKYRLEAVLSDAERSRLALTTAREVFGAVAKLQGYGRFVISDDPAMLEEGRRFGLEPLTDRVNQGQSAAVHQGFAAGLSNMAWASGQVLGGIGGGVVASATGYAAPSLGVAVLLMITVVYAYRVLEAEPVPPPVGG